LIQREKKGANRDKWSAPAIRSVVPLSHTRGGFNNLNDQDDILYRIS
jgi:hypothetical protein